MAAEKSIDVEKSVNEVIETVKTGKTTEFFKSLWENHQQDIIHFGKILLLTAVVLFLVWMFSRMIKAFIWKATGKIEKFDDSVRKLLYSIARCFIWIFATLIILDLFGLNTASILTVLGTAGIAIGLAMKDSLSNIAAGIMLVILRPYKTGDFIECGSISGTITEIGLFSTVITTFDGIFISAPNSVVFGTPIKNYSRNENRMANIQVGISYGDSLENALKILKEFLDSNELILKDPAPAVLVTELADNSVNLTLRYWTMTENYWTVFWQIKSELKDTIESSGLSIPFPQRVITFANAPADK